MKQSPGKFIILIIVHDSCPANTYLARASVYLISLSDPIRCLRLFYLPIELITRIIGYE